MKAGTRLTSTTDVRLREVPYARGTEFVVADEPKDGKTPVEVDAFTAGRWTAETWAILAPEAAAPAKVVK